MSTNKITRTRIAPEVKANILTALQNRGDNDTLATIAAHFSVSVGAVAQVAAKNNLTKKHAPKTPAAE